MRSNDDQSPDSPKELKAYVLNADNPPFQRLIRLMALLRSPHGCNWDRAQTHESLLPYLVEEAYEVVEAVERKDDGELKEELGDLLCQIVFHAQLASERKAFRIDDSVRSIVDKLIHRHPHVFAERQDLAPQEVRDQWERIKTDSGEKKSVLNGLPASMPALTMAFRIGEKAGGVGFDWETAEQVLEKVEEEISEIRQELARAKEGNRERLVVEFGDLLFAAASAARKAGVDPEAALKRALAKFRLRFERMEHRVRSNGLTFSEYSLDELEAIWQELKKDADGADGDLEH